MSNINFRLKKKNSPVSDTLIRPNMIKERGGIFGRALLHLMVKYFGKWSISLIALPVVFYYMTVMPGVRKNEMKYWSSIYPGCSKIKYLICIYKHYVMFGKTLIDRITAGHGIKTSHNFDCNSKSIIKGEIQKGNAIILLCSHIGGYNLFRFLCDSFDLPFHFMMYQNGDNENGSRYSMNDQLEKGNVRFINPAEPMNVIFEAVDVLNRREILLTMGDRVSGENSKYHEARMKGLKMKLPLGPWHIAYLTKAVVICIFIIKEKKEYRFIAQKPISFDYSGGIRKKIAIINAVSTYAEYLEEMIYKYPFQWFNFAADVITARE